MKEYTRHQKYKIAKLKKLYPDLEGIEQCFDPAFSPNLMERLVYDLKGGLDISKYANPLIFTNDQIVELSLAASMKDDHILTFLAHPEYSADTMKYMRNYLRLLKLIRWI